MRENSDDVSITASGAQLLQCQVGGVSAIRDPRIRDDLCPCCEPVVLQGLSLCTKPSSQTHFPHPCPRNTTCFLSREVCLPYNPKALSGPGCPFPPELPTQLQGTHYRGVSSSQAGAQLRHAKYLTTSHPELRKKFQARPQAKPAKPFNQAAQGPRITPPSRPYPTRTTVCGYGASEACSGLACL